MLCLQVALLGTLLVQTAHKSAASPIEGDPEVSAFIKSEGATLRTISLGDRSLAPRHLRPRAFGPTPDEGQPTGFGGNAPQPERGATGASFFHGSNTEIDKQNVDNVSPPTTDAGVVVNLKWSFSLSHTRLLKGGWVREQTATDLPPSKDFAAAELRLAPKAYRELHFHRVAEWAIVLNGTGRIAAVDEDGRNYISDVHGPSSNKWEDPSLWYFPPGVPHSIQALDDGLEFLVLFADGNFDSQGTTFMLSDWLAHTPLEILAQNFGVNVSEFKGIPQKDPYILPASVPPPQEGHASEQAIKSPAGEVPNPYAFDLGTQNKTVAPGGGGWVKIQDSVTNFPVSIETASALVYVEPNGLRELHFHRVDEWFYVISGYGRVTAFAGSSTARTFDFQTGDTGVFPVAYGHYVKNLSPTEPLIFLEIFKAKKFADFSAAQWLALTPHRIVADLLNITTETVGKFAKEKQVIIAGKQ